MTISLNSDHITTRHFSLDGVFEVRHIRRTPPIIISVNDNDFWPH